MSVMIHIARQLLRAFGKDEWFITVSGKQVFVLNPRVEDIDGQDIGHALCHICRFGGHTKKFYSVGQHSMLVHSIVENAFSEKAVEPIRGFFSPVTVATKKDIRTAFMHDSPEAYLGDVIRPLKTFLPVYKFIESLWWNVIAEKYALHQRMPAMVKYADRVALLTERRDLITPHRAARPWREDKNGPQPWPGEITPLEPYDCLAQFMARFSHLGLRTR